MLTNLSLRHRIFLFFCFLAVGGAGLAAGALAFGWSRGDDALPTTPFVIALIVFGFLNTGFVLGIWLLFDENVAKPIAKLSTQLRLKAHSSVDGEVDTEAAKYLGDLAPAASALSHAVGGSLTDTAVQVASETQRLQSEAARLTALLSEIPIATILVNPAREIVLYDRQAAQILSCIAPPRLKASLSDYFDLRTFEDGVVHLAENGGEYPIRLVDADGLHAFDGRMKSLGAGGHMVLIDVVEASDGRAIQARPLVYDFELLDPPETQDLADMPLSKLCCVAFDTETTGLSVANDEIIQIGAVRVLGSRIVEGESIDLYVDPGRPIPPSSTRIHGIGDADVAGAIGIAVAGKALHDFARDAVLVAHNAPFDIGLLRKSQSRMGVDWNHPVLDTVLLSAVVFGTTEEHSLDALCTRLSVGIAPEVRHTALGDARATAEVLVRLLPLLEGRGIRTFGHLLSETRKHSRLLQDMNS